MCASTSRPGRFDEAGIEIAIEGVGGEVVLKVVEDREAVVIERFAERFERPGLQYITPYTNEDDGPLWTTPGFLASRIHPRTDECPCGSSEALRGRPAGPLRRNTNSCTRPSLSRESTTVGTQVSRFSRRVSIMTRTS